MKIYLDAMGGDTAPLSPLEGAAMAVKEFGVEMVLVGDKAQIEALAAEHQIPLDGITILHTDDVISMEDQPTEITRSKKNCSMAVGLKALAEGEGDAFVSAGNSGALLVGATMITKRIKGIKRAAMAPVLPTATGQVILLDGGANTECRADMLEQFGIMGSIFMEKVMGVANPRVGLINNGTEECKGRDLERETYQLLSNANVNFVGNVEGRDLPMGVCDVMVTDGFTGNIVLKLFEGLGKFFAGKLKGMLAGADAAEAAVLKQKMSGFKDSFNYHKIGGAVLMGISRPVVKAHGSSNGEAFFNAIRVAKQCVEGKVCETIAAAVAERAEEA